MSLVIRIWQRIEPWFSDQMLQEAQRRIRSLEEIQSRWGVECDVVAEFDDEQVYRQLFYPRRNILSRRTRQSVRKELRSRSGNFFVNGTVAVFQDGEPFYYAPPHRAEFLESFREKGPAWLCSVVEQNEATAGRRSKAEKLALKFCERAEELGFHGHLKREYPLNLARLAGTSPAEDLGTSHTPFADLSAKSIDIVHDHEGTYDVMEVKPRLNWEALGQALGYRELLCVIENLPQDKVRAHIICKQIDSAIELACKRLGVGIVRVQ